MLGKWAFIASTVFCLVGSSEPKRFSEATERNKTILLTTSNTVIIKGEISQESVAAAQNALLESVKNRPRGSTTYLVLDSPGGDIQAGEQFIQFAKTIPRLETVSLFAASMASAIVQALPGKRWATDNGTLMFHRARGGFQGQFEDGEVESHLAYAKQIVHLMEERNSERMGMFLPDYKAAVKDEMWLYGTSAVNAGAADDTVDLVCSYALMAQRVQQTFSVMGAFTVTIETSACPILNGFKVLKGDDADAAAYRNYLKDYKRGGFLKGI